MASNASVVVDVKAKADLSALKATKAELADLIEHGRLSAEEFRALTAAYGDFSKKGNLKKVVDDLRGVEEQAKKTNAEIKKGEEAGSKGHQQIKLWQFSMAKATGEATVLVRELATGSFHARTLGAFLSAFGLAVQGAAIVLITIVAAIKAAHEAAKKLAEETEKGTQALLKSNEQWERMAKNVKDVGDMSQLTRAFTDDIRRLDEKIADLVITSSKISGFRRGLQELFAEMERSGAKAFNPLQWVGLLEPMAKLMKPLSDELLEAARKQQKEQEAIIAGNIEAAKSEEDKAVAIGASKQVIIEDTEVMGIRTTKTVDLYTQMRNLIDAQNACNTATIEGQKAFAEATDELNSHVKLMEKSAAINKVLDDHTKALNADVDRMVKTGNEHFEQILKETQAQEDLAKGLIPTRENQAALAEEMTEVKRQMDLLDRNIPSQEAAWQRLDARLKNLKTSYTEVGTTINEVTQNLEKMRAEVDRQVTKGTAGLQNVLDLDKQITKEAAVRNAAGNEELTIQEKVNQEYEKTRQKYEAINQQAGAELRTKEQIEQKAAEAGESLRHELEVKSAEGAKENELTEILRRQATVLDEIRQTQSLIGELSFVGVDATDAATLRTMREELEKVQRLLLEMQAKRATLVDPEDIAQADQNIQKLTFHAQSLGLKINAALHPMRAEFQNWANSFGSTFHQISTTIQQTVGVSLQALNQYLVTGKFNAQALLQQIIMLGLQLVEQLIIQRIVSAINKSAAIAEANIAGPAIATALAPAVTAQTIATAGSAAIAAPALVAAAQFAITGILSAHEGGPIRRRRMHGGGLASDEVPIIAQEGEIMIRRSVAQREGMADFLLGLNAGEFHSGGFVVGGRYHRGGGGGRFSGGGHGGWGGGGGSGFGGGPEVRIMREPDWAEAGFDPGVSRLPISLFLAGGFGTTPFPGANVPGGPTRSPTFWTNYPGVGFVPRAIPSTPGGWQAEPGPSSHYPAKKTSHRGGLISRFHDGGAVGGGGGSGIHIYAFTDLKALTRHMGSKDGQKIIFDTVKGRKIDLGMK